MAEKEFQDRRKVPEKSLPENARDIPPLRKRGRLDRALSRGRKDFRSLRDLKIKIWTPGFKIRSFVRLPPETADAIAPARRVPRRSPESEHRSAPSARASDDRAIRGRVRRSRKRDATRRSSSPPSGQCRRLLRRTTRRRGVVRERGSSS